jgi:hypothetical protein
VPFHAAAINRLDAWRVMKVLVCIAATLAAAIGLAAQHIAEGPGLRRRHHEFAFMEEKGGRTSGLNRLAPVVQFES